MQKKRRNVVSANEKKKRNLLDKKDTHHRHFDGGARARLHLKKENQLERERERERERESDCLAERPKRRNALRKKRDRYI